MGNIRAGNMYVKTMKKEICKDIAYLQVRYRNKRVRRQLWDGSRFLEMISKPPYSTCKRVSDLKKKISEERNNLKEKVKDLDRFMPGHQFSLFENSNELSIRQKEEAKKEIEKLKSQIHWLHKCLGMCTSREYFK